MPNLNLITSFDLETAIPIPIGAGDPFRAGPLGISVAGFTSHVNREIYTHPNGKMSRIASQALVYNMKDMSDNGYVFFTWNGTAFDFRVLAQESGMFEEVIELALGHCDMMMMVSLQTGEFVGLDRALAGNNLEGKRKTVILRDGTVIPNMNGHLFPTLWAQKEYGACLDYFVRDIDAEYELAREIIQKREVFYRTKPDVEAKPRLISELTSVPLVTIPTVRDMWEWPEPNLDGIEHPARRTELVAWMK